MQEIKPQKEQENRNKYLAHLGLGLHFLSKKASKAIWIQKN